MYNSFDKPLLPWEIIELTQKALKREKDKYTRRSFKGDQLEYFDRRNNAIGDMESGRDYVQSIEDFMKRKAEAIAKIRRKKFKVPDGLTKLSNSESRQNRESIRF